MTEPASPSQEAASKRACAWCGASATDVATTCAGCGAALAQRESIGDLAIPGLTSVDPALQDYDQRPLRLRGPSPSQGMASGLIAGAAAGGPIGLAVIGGVAAVAAAEYLGASRGGTGPTDPASVGRPSEVVLQALEHLEESEAGAAEGTADVWRDLPVQTPGSGDIGGEDSTDGG